MKTISLYNRNFLTEVIKSRNTLAFWLSVLGALLIVFLEVCIFWARGERLILKNSNPWDTYVFTSIRHVSSLLLPFYIILVVGLVINIEHKAKTWKYIYTLPIPKWMIYSSKLQYLFLLNLFTHILFFIFLIIGGEFLSMVRPDLNFANYPTPFRSLLLMMAALFISTLAILSVQYVLSMSFKNIFIPLGIGLAMIISSLIIIQWKYSYALPYLYPFHSTMNYLSIMENRVGAINYIGRSEILSISVFVIVSLIGAVIESKKEVK